MRMTVVCTVCLCYYYFILLCLKLVVCYVTICAKLLIILLMKVQMKIKFFPVKFFLFNEAFEITVDFLKQFRLIFLFWCFCGHLLCKRDLWSCKCYIEK